MTPWSFLHHRRAESGENLYTEAHVFGENGLQFSLNCEME